MTISGTRLHDLAFRLDDAARQGHLVTQISVSETDLSVEDAYAIQEAGLDLRIARGERLCGLKMGLTSLAKMRQMGVHTPIHGYLTDAMLRLDGAQVDLSSLKQPRVEPEVAFILASDLAGPVTPAQAMAAVGGVCGALEILDSRYQDFKFNLVDVVADNASSARFVLGSKLAKPDFLDIGCLGMVMEIDGKIVEIGSSAAIYDHPARSLAKLAALLAERGRQLKAGTIVLAGGATAAHSIRPGSRVRLEADGLGQVAFTGV